MPNSATPFSFKEFHPNILSRNILIGIDEKFYIGV